METNGTIIWIQKIVVAGCAIVIFVRVPLCILTLSLTKLKCGHQAGGSTTLTGE